MMLLFFVTINLRLRHLAVARPMDGREMLTWGEEHWFKIMISAFSVFLCHFSFQLKDPLNVLLFSSPKDQTRG